MSTTPELPAPPVETATLPEVDTLSENADYAMRIACLEFASKFCTAETPLSEFLDKAADVEKFVRTGRSHVR